MESNKIEINPGDAITIEYKIGFQNTKLEKKTIDLDELGKIIKETTQKNLNLYCYTRNKCQSNK